MNNKNKSFRASPPGVSRHSAKDYISKRFDNSRRMRRLNKVELAFSAQILKHIPNHDELVVDIPCGSGRLSNILSQYGKQNYLGIDVAEKMLNEARSQHPNLNYISGNILNIPINNNEATLILCMRLLHHVPSAEERIKILTELARVSSQWVAISFYRTECFRSISKRLRNKNIKGHPISIQTLLSEAAQVGLAKEKIVYNWLTGGAQTLVLLKKHPE